MKKVRLFLVAMMALTMSFMTFAKTTAPAEKFSNNQVQQIQKIVHDYLVTNPQVLLEASRALQTQQEKQAQTSAMKAISANKAALFDDKNSPSIGNPDASVTVVEFFDYQCGHCRAMAPVINKVTDADKSLHVIFKELPIFGGMSKVAAEAALASAKQGKYHEFHNALFNVSGPLNKKIIMNLAKKSGLNIKQLKKDMDSAAVKKELADNFKLAQALKIMGTPTFVLSNKAQTKFHFIPGATSLENLKEQIKSLK